MKRDPRGRSYRTSSTVAGRAMQREWQLEKTVEGGRAQAWVTQRMAEHQEYVKDAVGS